MHRNLVHSDQESRPGVAGPRLDSPVDSGDAAGLLFEVRRANLKRLIAEAKGVLRLAHVVGRSPSHISQISQRIAYRRNGKVMYRQMGDKVARHLEQATGKPHGWMDHDHTVAPAVFSPETLALATAIDQIAESGRRRAVLEICKVAVDFVNQAEGTG